ncbi:MAG: glycosyltransferase [Solirubrobacterales bacterium]|nr:glycosyltransferase [Solirubrobacterales bacterium]
MPTVVESSCANGARVCIVSASGQNVFFAELLEAIGNVLTATGMLVEHSVDRFPVWREGVVYLFVPHEYTPLVEAVAYPTEMHLARTIVLCTEQPGTSWFEEAAELAARAAAVVDINLLGVQALDRRGIEASLMQLGYVPEWDRWGGKDTQARPTDVVFMGAHTPRRGRALARCAPWLIGRKAALTVTESLLPHSLDSTSFLSGERRWEVLKRSKVMVNIHRNELGYLEWLRVLGAMANGCVVLTEHSLGFEPLVPGEHFLSASYENLPLALDAALSDPDRLREISHAVYGFIRDELPLSMTITPLVRAIEKVAAESYEPPTIVTPPVPPSPRRLELPPTEYQRIISHRSDSDRVRAALKSLVLGQQELSRRICETASEARPPHDAIELCGPREDVRVSIVLTVYDYASVVAHAISSAAHSDFQSYELIVIDDCSRDDSLEVIRREITKRPRLAATIIARGRNQGLAAARNCGVEHARGELIFVLDADNMVYSHCLSRLVDVLDEDPGASFAYGMIETFGPEGPRDLMSWNAWDPMRLRYGNYIDAMAMIRRSAIEEVGGYTGDRRLHGWEDFDLWCAFADRGWHGAQVNEILTRYRMGASSMISTTDIDAFVAWEALVERHPALIPSRSVVSDDAEVA